MGKRTKHKRRTTVEANIPYTAPEMLNFVFISDLPRKTCLRDAQYYQHVYGQLLVDLC